MLLSTYEDIQKILLQKGVKAAVSVSGNPKISIYCDKSDLFKEIQSRKELGYTGPTDYDGNPVNLYFNEADKVMLIDGGI